MELDYKLELPPQMSRIHNVFHVDKLLPWKGNPVNGIQPPPPGPVKVDNEEEYKVEDVLDSRWVGVGRGRKKRLEYNISFIEYGPESNEWLPEENLEHAPKKIEEFHCQHPSAPRCLAATAFASLFDYM